MAKTLSHSAQPLRERPLEREPHARVERRKEKTRRLLLQVALDLIYEKGIYWTTIEDMTERADVGKGTFYQYFETKEALLQELLQSGLKALVADVEQAVRSTETTAMSMVKAVLSAQVAFYVNHPEYLLFFHQVRGLLQMEKQAGKELREVYAGYLDQLAELVRPALGEAHNSREQACAFAMALSAFTSGFLIDYLLFHKGGFAECRDDIQARVEGSIQALIQGGMHDRP